MSLPGFLTAQHAAFIRHMNQLVEIAKRPPEAWAALLSQQPVKRADLPTLVWLMVPAMDNIVEACRRNHAALRSAIVGIAAERFRRQHGRWPTTPDELARAGLLAAVPADPYDGRPI